MRIDKYLLGGIVVALAAVFVIGASWYRQDEQAAIATITTGSTDRLVRPYSPTLGPADAPITLVEFLDPECEACGAMHPIVKRVMEEFDGLVRLVVRYMPLHPNSVYAAGLLEGARSQEMYWELMDAFFSRQPEWASHDAPRPELLAAYAAQLGLDIERLTAAASDAEVERRIRQDTSDGQALGVNRTPTFFVNGRPLARVGYEPLRSAIVAALPAR
jgi:protein-disulfide isomerase